MENPPSTLLHSRLSYVTYLTIIIPPMSHASAPPFARGTQCPCFRKGPASTLVEFNDPKANKIKAAKIVPSNFFIK